MPGFKGTISMEDTTIIFHDAPAQEGVPAQMNVTIIDTHEGKVEDKVVPQDKFFKALAIAVHPDGMPDTDKDYPDAESIMGEIRWIP